MCDMRAVTTDDDDDSVSIPNDSRILVLDVEGLLSQDNVRKLLNTALFAVGTGEDGLWYVISLSNFMGEPTHYRAKLPEAWRGLSGEELCKKISDYSAICKFGDLGFLEGKLPSDFKELSESGCWFDAAALKALSIDDAISCNTDGLVLQAKSKKSAIRIAEIAADYSITRD